MKKIVIYTDGACSGNPGPGGWAAIMINGETEKEIIGSEKNTTNNRMELTAAIKSLESLKGQYNVELYTDSKYLKNGITEWIFNWKKNNWKSSNKKQVKNIDLWKELDEVANKHEISWHWVKAHAEDLYNLRVDKLAVDAIKKV
ncbi:MAG: ribonuclease HI [Rickettsiales bacterium]|nr:ribonuclease HI [Rickettsiales bacterium]